MDPETKDDSVRPADSPRAPVRVADGLFARAIEGAPTGVVIIDPAGRIVFVNRALEQQFGYARNELIGQSVELLVDDASRLRHAALRADFIRTPHNRSLSAAPVLTGRRKDGSSILVKISLDPIVTNDGTSALAWVLDVTERCRLEHEQQREMNERLDFERLVSELSASFVDITGDDVDRAMRDALQQISEALDLDRTLLFEVRDADVVLTHSWSRLAEPTPLTLVSVRNRFPWSVAAILNGHMVAYSSPDEIPDPIERESVHAFGTKSRIAFPLSIAGAVVGAISFGTVRQHREWPPAVVGRLQLIAQVFASALARKRADTAFRASEGRFRALADDAPVLIWVSAADGQCTWFNRQWLEFVGQSMAHEVGNGWIRNVHVDDLQDCLTTYTMAFDARRPFSMEYRLRRHDGAWRWVLDNGTPMYADGGVFAGYIGSCVDITEAKESILQLDLLHRITRSIGGKEDLGHIYELVLRAVREDIGFEFGCICDYDTERRVLKVSHCSPESSSLTAQLSLSEAGDIPVVGPALTDSVAGRTFYETDLSLAGTPFRLTLANAGLGSMVATPLRVEDRVFGVLIIARAGRDAFSAGVREFLQRLSEHVGLAAHQAHLRSALQAAYDDLRHSQDAVIEQERLRVVGQMASGIAHDINNGLSPVSLYTEAILEREPALREDTREYLRTIQRAVDDVGQTLDRLNDFSKRREPAMTLSPVDVNALAEQVRNLTRARWRDMPLLRRTVIEMRLDLAEGLPAVRGVEAELREALTNLVLNAVDALPAGGVITLRTRLGAADDGGTTQPSFVKIEVEDNGVGMSDDTRRRCLEPFFTTKGAHGSGLGLAMVYGVVQRHAATLDIDSRVGVGTIFRLTFAAQPHASPDVHGVVMPPLPPMRILVVDDDPVVVKSLTHVLERDGHTVATANDGREGIDVFHQSSGNGRPFDVVITDLSMPHVDGTAVAAAVKLASPATSVVLLTGWGGRLLVEDELPPNVDRVLDKPPRLQQLRLALARVRHAGITRRAHSGH